MNKFWHLNQLDLVSHLSEGDKDTIHQLMTDRTYVKGERIFNEGDESGHFYIIKSGKVRTYKLSPDGKELTLSILKKGDLFGELSVVSDDPREVFAEAFEDSYVCKMSTDNYQTIKDKMNQFSVKIQNKIWQNRKEIEGRLEDIIFLNVEDRLRKLLNYLAKNFGKSIDQNETLIDIKLTHQNIADLLGIYRQTASAIIGKFQDEQLLRIHHKKIILLKSFLAE
jgi:CRP/FNR family transcriptional regulator, cyclic AMP receptor protein